MGNSICIFVQLRGGMDGLAALMPDDDQVLRQKRPGLLVDGYRPIQSGFAFHPSLTHLQRLYQNNELSFLHACGLPVQDRSHFKSQDFLATGGVKGVGKTGWLAKIIEAIPGANAVAFGSTVPLLLKGTSHALNWSSPQVTREDEAVMRKLAERIYAHDPVLKDLYPHVQRIANLSGGFRRSDESADGFKVLGKMIARVDGPDIGYISLGNYDTHNNQNARIAVEFKKLDQGIHTLKKELGESWNDTVVIIASEFGRSVHQNGTKGTDHGTGGVCMIAGGAVNGGISLGKWPGLEPENLYQNRDVFPAFDIRTVFANIAESHMGMKKRFIRDELFPEVPDNYMDMAIIRGRKSVLSFV